MTPKASYHTAPLAEYNSHLRHIAESLFSLVRDRVGAPRVRAYEGSYSILHKPAGKTAAKIVIYQAGVGAISYSDKDLVDGVYVWIRVPGAPSERTIGVEPHPKERFAYFRLGEDQNSVEVADFIAACADRDLP